MQIPVFYSMHASVKEVTSILWGALQLGVGWRHWPSPQTPPACFAGCPSHDGHEGSLAGRGGLKPLLATGPGPIIAPASALACPGLQAILGSRHGHALTLSVK